MNMYITSKASCFGGRTRDVSKHKCIGTQKHGQLRRWNCHLMLTPWRRLRWAVHVTRMRESRNAQRILMGNQEYKWLEK
jgi:hypothetical protein